ncbi:MULTISPECIES: HlyD family secretion protein [unclassified Rubrivivax]|uniref:HlyD family secretion protein n=1 Tax=unclassified Rubrivivax TaxID=2649762 RepID=UPI001E3B381B|nr:MULTISPECIES: efflux RND transporter periplasmic adaptor subunit [unclassified Rubrivivax]MCC9597864.1 efflux RND transporter periplasmic adaptor subunit [Rubrivivax sp. JA1055]MCC9645879.1 efflux RND transporter periplasmic adaptor subunit [Rubrivivax sp. JA1029]
MSDSTKLVALPAYLPRRLQAFRIVRGDKTSYVLRDKLADRTYDVEQWQFFVLEVLPGCETAEKLLSVFADRFGREIGEHEVMAFFAQLADQKLLDDEAAKHPLLKPFTRQGYALEQGLIKPKSFEELAVKMASQAPRPGAPAAPAPGPTPGAPDELPEDAVLPAGVNEADSLDPRQSRQLFRFFPMQPVARALLPVVEPLKYAVYLLPLVALLALILVLRHIGTLWSDIGSLRSATTLAVHALFSLVTINLAVVVTQSLVAQKFRASLGDFGIGLRFGFFPRFMVPIRHTLQLSRRERMWMHAGPLLVRVLLFSLGVLIWYNARGRYEGLTNIGLGLTFLCAVNLLVEGGNPLVKGNGYHLLSAFVDEPQLRGKAYRAFLDRLRGGASTERGQMLLASFALASFVYAYLVVLLIVYVAGHFLIHELRLGGAALIVVVALGVFLAVRTTRRFKLITRAYERSQQFERWRKRALPSETAEQAQAEAPASRTWYYMKRALAVTLLLLLFLPYPYDAGGDFEIYPAARQVVTTDVAGIVEEVNFDGGEQVAKGQVIARVASTDLKAQLQTFDARIAAQRAVVAELKSRPRKEEVALAQSELEIARQRARFSGERVPRLERMHQERTISFEELDSARKEAEVDRRELAQREAALALVRAGTPPDRIAAEEATLQSLVQQRAEVEGRAGRTVMTMPFDGTILSLRLKDRLNSVLDKGAPFATVEANGSMTVEIDVPEGEIGHVKVGAPVRVRPNAFNDRTFEGRVERIDGNVSVKPAGRVVKVVAVVDNGGGALKSGMTGYAKVDAGTMPVWQAFSQAVVRFVNVQVWSWLP